MYALIRWFFRAWPFIVCFLLIIIHQYTAKLPCFFEAICWSNSTINKYLSFALNVTGGILVIYSIDSNLGLFKKGNLIILFNNWIKSFPLIKRDPLIINAESGSYTMTGHPVRIQIHKPPETIDELYKYTQEQIAFLCQDLKEERRNRDEVINKLSEKWSSKHLTISDSVTEINEQLKAIAIGGIKLQIFGVLLVVYGSYIGLSA